MTRILVVDDETVPDDAWDLDPDRARSANAWRICLRRLAGWRDRSSVN